MKASPPPRQALSLEAAESSAPAGDAMRKASDQSASTENAKRDLGIRTSDDFLAQAAKEYQEGRIDQALWRRAADQGADDASLVIAAYLRARATALQLQRKRTAVAQGGARKSDPARGTSEGDGDSEPRPIDAPVHAVARSRAMQSNYLIAAAAAGIIAVAAVVWLFAPRREAIPQAAVSTVTPSPTPSASPPHPASEATVVGGPHAGDTRPNLEARVQELKQAGNWNVLVLYASEWTRKEPTNPTAWQELSVGYAKMRQLDDAFQAAAKAVALAPQNALLWNNLGHVNLSLERLPEAKVAFDRALSLLADDPDTLCSAALVAQRQGRSSDADALAGRVKAADGGCRGVSSAAPVAH
jgi:tetratricopeptide (TPR) repeat protein